MGLGSQIEEIFEHVTKVPYTSANVKLSSKFSSRTSYTSHLVPTRCQLTSASRLHTASPAKDAGKPTTDSSCSSQAPATFTRAKSNFLPPLFSSLEASVDQISKSHLVPIYPGGCVRGAGRVGMDQGLCHVKGLACLRLVAPDFSFGVDGQTWRMGFAVSFS
ncbi:hypothetical protein HDV57DRAFT_176811 [Trichoderma longibrachiatum]|uniref:Uncharacterized protein n=1 Tax=Trichoderma longibrachiatum ATCC 18648 TaxID=983965 RepID=A0A2T4CAM4_TRILO|nr:hypothetical protein M440DRAFT_1197783 [Trichoderma longibrachiatum ATCC 18648]